MAAVHNLRSRTRSIVVGVLDDRYAGALAYALKVSLDESATVRIVRVSSRSSSRVALHLPIHTVEATGGPLEVLIDESRAVELLVVQVPADAVAALVDPLLVQLRRHTRALLIEVDDRGEIVRASGPEGWSYAAGPDLTFAMPPAEALPERVICVGVDSSPASGSAVIWAAAMAAQSSAALKLVSVYGSSGSTMRRTKQDAWDDIAVASAHVPGPPPQASVARGEPADRLLDASRGAVMLVIGRHSTQGLLHSASASVGDTCARLAGCPVVVVPHG